MKGVFPSGLTGRITLILTLGFFSAQGIALWVFLHDRIVTSMQVFGLSFADRVVTTVDVLDTLPLDEQPKLLQALNSRFLQVGILETSPPQPKREAWHAEDLRQEVTSHLNLKLNRPVEVQVLNRWSGSPFEAEAANQFIAPIVPSRQTMVIAVNQADDRWLVFVAPTDIASLRHSWHLWVWLMAIGFGIWLISIWAARRVTQPIMQFAVAAEQFGRDINAPALPETGSQELRRSIQAFNQMQERLRRLVNDRTFMLAAISHDLRTVLTRLRLRADFIAEAEQAQKAIADIDQMQAMLDEALTFAQEASVTEAYIKVDLAHLLQSLCDDFTDAGEQAMYSGPTRLTYIGKPTALRRAFMNLIHNAVTYGRRADVTLMSEPESVKVMIGDRGPGIAPDLREKVFTPFFRLEHSRNRETGGTGLGLTVAQTAIQRHGGEIRLTERPGGGLLVQVSLLNSH